ncbi:hypothetical protein [Halomonas litopenaei]|uniref:hypothetical protein n=1 Tax=Halomonas litopenaei TaxID=2109328 RepID=UPI003F9FF05D
MTLHLLQDIAPQTPLSDPFSPAAAQSAVLELDGARLVAVATLPQRARGAIGKRETAIFRQAIATASERRLPLLMLIDSAGARVDEGVAVQGNLRALIGDLLVQRQRIPGILAVLGRHTFGGASLVAMCADQRLYPPGNRLAMSGPRLLYAHNTDPRRVDAVISSASRLRRDPAGHATSETPTALRDDIARWLASPRRCSLNVHPEANGGESTPSARENPSQLNQSRVSQSRRGQQARIDCHGSAPPDHRDLADLALAIGCLPAGLSLILRCQWSCHSLRAIDEARLQSLALVRLASTIEHRVRSGAAVELAIDGELSGGVYLALAACASQVKLTARGRVRSLPSRVAELITPHGDHPRASAEDLYSLGIIDTLAPRDED